jgi:hypothetical protein
MQRRNYRTKWGLRLGRRVRVRVSFRLVHAREWLRGFSSQKYWNMSRDHGRDATERTCVKRPALGQTRGSDDG